MKILITIAHYFKQHKEAKHASQKDPQPRIRALSESILSLQQNFGISNLMIQVYERKTIPANQLQDNQLDIVICTTGENHLVEQIPLPKNLFRHHNTQAEPLYLGWECHRFLAENIGKYDYYCFLEDDLIIKDANFFTKLNWFNDVTGMDKVLFPNRYELGLNKYTGKCYIDGDLRAGVTQPYQNINNEAELTGKVMNQPVTFRRPLNPHSGCFFLTNEQIQHWSEQEHFLVKDDSFISPLESAATLGIMKTFKIYKPASENANFLEINHYGMAFMSLPGSVVYVF